MCYLGKWLGLGSAAKIIIVLSSVIFNLRFEADASQGLFHPEHFVLDNGMKVVVVSDHRSPVVRHMVWYKVGAADDPPGKSGLAHYLEHMMFKGTKNVFPGKFSSTVSRLGGTENAFTGYDYTAYYQNIAVQHLETVMYLEADRMTNLVLNPADFEVERNVVFEERRSRVENNPGALLSEQMGAAQFLAHPYGRPIIGWHHEISNLKLSDLDSFYKTYYSPSNAILIVAGDVKVEAVRKLAQKYYGKIENRQVADRVRAQEPPHTASRKVVMRDSRVPLGQWSRSYLAPSRLAGKVHHVPALQVLAKILGGGTTARLYQKLVVEEKIASDSGAFYRGNSLDLALFHAYAVPNVDGNLKSIELAIEKEIKKIKKFGVSSEELARAKKNMIASAIYARDSLSVGSQILGAALAVGRTIDDVESWTDQIEDVTEREVMDAARHVFQEQRSVTGVLLPEATQ